MFLRRPIDILSRKPQKDQFCARGVNFLIKNHVFLRRQTYILSRKLQKDQFCARGVNFSIKNQVFLRIQIYILRGWLRPMTFFAFLKRSENQYRFIQQKNAFRSRGRRIFSPGSLIYIDRSSGETRG